MTTRYPEYEIEPFDPVDIEVGDRFRDPDSTRECEVVECREHDYVVKVVGRRRPLVMSVGQLLAMSRVRDPEPPPPPRPWFAS
jgi:hypothetical protein